MKKIFLSVIIIAIISSCGGGSVPGELTGVPGRKGYIEPEALGMVKVPSGSYNMGPSDQDVSWAQNTNSKTVTIPAFWMDETEITNNEYRQFVQWVVDSLMRRKLGEIKEEYLISEDQFGNAIDPPFLNWETEINLEEQDAVEAVKDLYYAENERFNRKAQIDTRKLMYEYQWVDIKQASLKSNRFNFATQAYEGVVYNPTGEKNDITNRAAFVMSDAINVYPDTLCWVHDFTYSYNEPMTNDYFWHPAYDNYPVVGVSWKQATAFCLWRTKLLNVSLEGMGESSVHEYRLPSESEWEYAARGGLGLAMYPWGGMYTRNNQGCFLANFKPLRGNYRDDGWVYTSPIARFDPNEYGLYDMAGNVAEWTSSAYDESSYVFTHDLSPDYKYNALPDDQPVMKRKVLRGGSWKDIAYFLQVGTRTYEYQDTAKAYIGFRCIRSVLGE